MIGLEELDLALKGLRVYADAKSDLPENELQLLRDEAADIERRGWQIIGSGSPGAAAALLEELKAVLGPLSRGIRRKRGRGVGSISAYTIAKDSLVLADIEAGATQAQAIRNHYQHGIEGHRKRIRRRVKAIKEQRGHGE